MRISRMLAILSCAQIAYAPCVFAGSHEALIAKHAATYAVPESLVRRVIQFESRGNARAVSKGNYGLMQIRLGTARAMGYRGNEQGLLDADTNLAYAVKYLAGAYRAAGCNEGRAISYYQRGYYGARQAKCHTPAQSAAQIAQRPTYGNSVTKPAARIGRKTIVVGAASDPAVPQTPDVLRPRPVQTQIITKPMPGPMPRLAANSEPVAMPGAPAGSVATDARANAERPMPSSSTGPTAPPVSVAKREPTVAPLPAAKPSIDRAPPKTVAAVEPEAVPIPAPRPEVIPAYENAAKPAHRHAHKRFRASAKAANEPEFVKALKKLFNPKPDRRSSRGRLTRQLDQPRL
jgi:hypothetical protein